MKTKKVVNYYLENDEINSSIKKTIHDNNLNENKRIASFVDILNSGIDFKTYVEILMWLNCRENNSQSNKLIDWVEYLNNNIENENIINENTLGKIFIYLHNYVESTIYKNSSNYKLTEKYYYREINKDFIYDTSNNILSLERIAFKTFESINFNSL